MLFWVWWSGKAVLSDKVISNWRPIRGMCISRKNNLVSRNQVQVQRPCDGSVLAVSIPRIVK